MAPPEGSAGHGSADAAIGVDIGGTKIAAGVVDAHGRVHHRRRRPTPDDAAALVTAVAETVAALGAGPAPLGVGFPGFIDLTGTVRGAPNLPALAGEPLQQRLEARCGGAVTVVNDADGAAWAELERGAGRGLDGVAMLTVGTGVGGGLIIDGQPVRGAQGAAGELGHIIVDEGGPPCPCGNHGCLEAHASGTAIARKARQRVAAGHVDPASPLAASAELHGEVVTAAAADGDPDATAVIADTGFWLGVGIASIANALDPPVVVIGGGAASGAGETLLAPARRACAERLLGRPAREPPPVRPGELGEDAGLIGAALLARRNAPG